ncbi:MAG: co-chaperone GroES [Spirochaetae bacterium HGW-Spirochaetae-7]|nr:MAG: co-chaperone GroES [Spirochaetae bacterium HGW-Spirochaetae-7]
MKVSPLGDRVLIKVQEGDTKTAGGIIIPQTAQEKTQTGVIVAVGHGVRDDAGKLVALEVKVGEKVMYDKYAGTQIKIDGADHLIVKFSDVLAVIE